jgi:hypothetical protein
VEASNAIFDQLGEARGISLCPLDQVLSSPASYSGVIIGWTAYSHIPTRERMGGVFTNAAPTRAAGISNLGLVLRAIWRFAL